MAVVESGYLPQRVMFVCGDPSCLYYICRFVDVLLTASLRVGKTVVWLNCVRSQWGGGWYVQGVSIPPFHR